jgi:hypothetical protein
MVTFLNYQSEVFIKRKWSLSAKQCNMQSVFSIYLTVLHNRGMGNLNNQYIPILPSTQQLFINIWGTTCFDPNGPSSGAARLTHSTTELQHAHSHLHTYVNVNPIRRWVVTIVYLIIIFSYRCYSNAGKFYV